MIDTTQRLLALTVAAAMTACTTLRPIQEGAGSGASRAHRQAQSVAVGEAVTINPKQGSAFVLVVTAVNSDSIVGTHSGQSRQVMLSDIELIEHNRFDALRTSLLVLGVIALRQYANGVSKLTNP